MTDRAGRRVRSALLSALQSIIAWAKGLLRTLGRQPKRVFNWIRRRSLAVSHSFWRLVEQIGQSLSNSLETRLMLPLRGAPKASRRLVLRFWAFLGRCGIALRRLLSIFIWRPLLVISKPFRPIFSAIWAFLGRCGIALRRILTVVVWRPFYFLSTPVRWRYMR